MRGLHLAAALSLLAGCTHVRAVRTLAAGETELAIDEGGPIVLGVGAQRALFPFGSPGHALRHGFERGEIHGAVHALPAAFGVVWLEAGGSFRLFDQRGARPYLLTTLAVHAATDGPHWVGATQLTLVASWAHREGRVVPYLGWDSILAFPDVRYVGAAFAGVRVGSKVFLAPELRWLLPWERVEPVAFRPLSPGRGVLGLGLSIGARFPLADAR